MKAGLPVREPELLACGVAGIDHAHAERARFIRAAPGRQLQTGIAGRLGRDGVQRELEIFRPISPL